MSRYPWYVCATFFLYTLVWDGGIIGGCAYAVFWLDHSGWWFALAVSLAGISYKPRHWAALFDPDMAKKNQAEAEREAAT